jgi:protein TonB
MIAKKNSRYDLESKRSAFFQLGLFVVGSITLAAFTYSDPMMRADAGNEVARESIAITWDLTEQPKEKPEIEISIPIERPDDLKQSTVTGTELPDEKSGTTGNKDSKVNPNVGVGTGGVIVGPINKIGTGLVNVTSELIEDIVDKEAAFVGGYLELQKFIGSKISYPQEAIEFNEQGKVFMSFVVEKDGSITNVVVERGVSNSLDREAKRIIKTFPEWIPGEIKMQRVRTRVRLPINFVLNN